MKTLDELRKEFEGLGTVKKLMIFCKWSKLENKYVNIWDDVDFIDPINSINWMFEMFQELNKDE